MVQQCEARNAAKEYVEEFADYDEEFELHQELIADEQFGVLAFLHHTLKIYAGEFEGHVDKFTYGARGGVKLALERRAKQVREEVDDK